MAPAPREVPVQPCQSRPPSTGGRDHRSSRPWSWMMAGTLGGLITASSLLPLLFPCQLGSKHKMITNHCYSTVIKNTDSGTNWLSLNPSSTLTLNNYLTSLGLPWRSSG